MSGFDDLDAMIRGLRRLPGMAERVAKRAAPGVAEALKATTRAGESPEGQPWAPRKKDGAQALQNAAEALTVRAAGAVIVMTVTGPEAIHHKGSTRLPRRPQLPDGDVPPALLAAVEKAAEEEWRRAIG